MATEFYIAELEGGDIGSASYNESVLWTETVCGHQYWYVLGTTERSCEETANECDARVISVEQWDGSSFGDDHGCIAANLETKTFSCPAALAPTIRLALSEEWKIVER